MMNKHHNSHHFIYFASKDGGKAATETAAVELDDMDKARMKNMEEDLKTPEGETVSEGKTLLTQILTKIRLGKIDKRMLVHFQSIRKGGVNITAPQFEPFLKALNKGCFADKGRHRASEFLQALTAAKDSETHKTARSILKDLVDNGSTINKDREDGHLLRIKSAQVIDATKEKTESADLDDTLESTHGKLTEKATTREQKLKISRVPVEAIRVLDKLEPQQKKVMDEANYVYDKAESIYQAKDDTDATINRLGGDIHLLEQMQAGATLDQQELRSEVKRAKSDLDTTRKTGHAQLADVERQRKAYHAQCKKVGNKPKPEEVHKFTREKAKVSKELARAEARLLKDIDSFELRLHIHQYSPAKLERIKKVKEGALQKAIAYRKALEKAYPPKLLENLKKDLDKLDREVYRYHQELEAPRAEAVEFLRQNLERIRTLQGLADRTGIDINTAEKLKIWLLSNAGLSRDLDAPTPLKLEGVVTDKTGKATKKIVTIQVLDVDFNPPETESYYDETPRETLKLTIINEAGDKETVNEEEFARLMDAFGGHEDIEDFDTLNDRIAEHTGYLGLNEEDIFTKKVLVSVNDNGKMIYEDQEFKVEKIDRKTKTIELDRPVIATPKEWLPQSLDSQFYFDRKQKTFKFGEFAKLIHQHKYKKEVGEDQADNSRNARSEYLKKQVRKDLAGAPQEMIDRALAQVATPVPALQNGSSTRVNYVEPYSGTRIPAEFRRNDPTVSAPDHTGPGTPDTASATSAMPAAAAAATTMAAGAAAAKKAAAPQPSSPSPADPTPPNHSVHALNEFGQPSERPIAQYNGKGSRLDLSNLNQIEGLPADDNFGGFDDDFAGGNPRSRTGAQPTRKYSEFDLEDELNPENIDELPPPRNIKKLHNEALPYDKIYKYGDMNYKEASLVSDIWRDTRVLSLSDMWEMGKTMWEYYDRRHQRRQKERYSTVAKDLPYFGNEMERINQQQENEEVNQFKETLDQTGVYDIQDRLRYSKNKDEIKAAFLALTEKGMLRWDDIGMWENINKWVPADIAIPIPSNRDPYTRIDKDVERTGFDYIKGAVDYLWGDGTYNDWYNKNKSTFASQAKSFYEEGKELEGVEGGHQRRLSTLLRMHKMGEFVDPEEYEGLVLHAIEAGKARMHQKVYYLIEGVAAVNGDGRTILPFERVAHINSEMLTKFPLLEYICSSVPRPDGKGEHRFTLDDYKKWVHEWDGNPKDPEKNKPGEEVMEFLWKVVLPSDATQDRINKVLRAADGVDHDDMFGYIPPASEQGITDVCGSATGNRKYLTIEGYANAFPGFSEYMRNLAQIDNRQKLNDAIRSYVRFESIMTNKWKRGDRNLQRLDYTTMNNPPIVSGNPPKAFIEELNVMIGKVIYEYQSQGVRGADELASKWDIIHKTRIGNLADSSEKKKNQDVQYALETFGKVFNRVVKSDNGAIMTRVVSNADLYGMPDYFKLSPEAIAARKSEVSNYTNPLAID
jgi:hypothetical protein